MSYRTAACCIGLIAVFALTGCGSGRHPAPGATAAVHPTLSRAPGGNSRFGSLKIPPAQLAVALKGLSAFQTNLIKDGVLTFGEYEQATFATIQCYEDAGFTVQSADPASGGAPGPRLTARGRYDYAPVSAPHADPRVGIPMLNRCSDKYSSTINFLWAGKTAPTAKDAQDARDALGACLRDAGHDAPMHPSGSDFARIEYPPTGMPTANQLPPAWYLDCARRIAVQFDLPAIPG